MEITGRLTADAVVRTVKDDKKVVGFSVVINDSYRTNGEKRDLTTFIDCSFWRNEAIALYLKKGSLVQLYGRIGVNAYVSHDGSAKGVLTFHVSDIKLFGASKLESTKSDTKTAKKASAKAEESEPPF
ncbi:single-stranded DNA-binding protein [Pedobacter sp. MW01-1-1]|uniref:single-stranded DNA-binding protein n=1 Tax=Pedobacter sp. MW01-1-1 TaxID=3383027 RepID=UPI003FEF9AA4